MPSSQRLHCFTGTYWDTIVLEASSAQLAHMNYSATLFRPTITALLVFERMCKSTDTPYLGDSIGHNVCNVSHSYIKASHARRLRGMLAPSVWSITSASFITSRPFCMFDRLYLQNLPLRHIPSELLHHTISPCRFAATSLTTTAVSSASVKRWIC